MSGKDITFDVNGQACAGLSGVTSPTDAPG